MKKTSFSQLIASDQPVLVDFYADWCGPCQTLSPIVQRVAGDLGGQAKVIKINVDRNAAVAGQYQVRSIPTLILFREGKPVWRHTGLITAQALTTHIRAFLPQSSH